jgi:hypothetical protein
MNLERSDGSSVNTQQKVDMLLKKRPSEPGFTQGTISYCNDAVDASLAKFKDALTRTLPSSSDLIQDMVTSAEIIHAKPPQSNFVASGEKVQLQYPNGDLGDLNNTLRSVYSVDPELGPLKYAGKLFFSRDRKRMSERYPWFNSRLSKVAEIGNLNLEDPKIQYIALAYVTQVAKNITVDESRELLKRSQLFGGISDLEKLSTFMEGVKGSVYIIRQGQSFISKCFDAMDSTANRSGINEEQRQLLLDIAFIRNRAFDDPQEFRQALNPLIQLISQEKWSEALELRDFLIKYFSTSFPKWRAHGFKLSSGNTVFEGFKDLAKALASGKVSLTEEDVPEIYRPAFEGKLSHRMEKARYDREKQILKGTVGLSNVFIQELARDTQVMLREHRITTLMSVFGEYSDEVKSILTSSEMNENEKYESFYIRVKLIDPETSDKQISQTYRVLSRAFFVTSEAEITTPCVLRTPNEKRLIEVEYYDYDHKDIQIYWHQTDSTVDYSYRGTKYESRMKNYRNFGRFVYDLLLIGIQNQSSEKPVLKTQQVLDALNRAYTISVSDYPHLAQTSIKDYLRSLLHSFLPVRNRTNIDPVVQLIDSL